jgi:short-subunit dehydrogenase
MAVPDSRRRGKTALITGASSGIGYELTKLFARDGYNLVLVARDETRLQAIADDLAKRHGIVATVVAQDLAQADAAAEVYARAQSDGAVVDVLVNNAGFATYGLFAATDLQAQLDMLQVNTVALTHLTHLFLQGMLQRRSGRILNVASTAAFQPGPLMAAYYASKAYVLSFSEALANELRGSGVDVTTLCPGPTASGFQKRASMEDSKLVAGSIADAASVARAGYDGLQRGRTLVIPGTRNRVLAFSVRLLPRGVVTGIVRRGQERVRAG